MSQLSNRTRSATPFFLLIAGTCLLLPALEARAATPIPQHMVIPQHTVTVRGQGGRHNVPLVLPPGGEHHLRRFGPTLDRVADRMFRRGERGVVPSGEHGIVGRLVRDTAVQVRRCSGGCNMQIEKRDGLPGFVGALKLEGGVLHLLTRELPQ